MPEQFSEKMGAIRIYSWGAGQPHRGPNLVFPPENWVRIRVGKYISRSWLGSSKPSLADVVKTGILDSENPILLSVHMYQGPEWDKTILGRQLSVTQAAKQRGYPIYVTWRQQPEAVATTTLPGELQNAVKGYDKLYYYNGLPGNALEGAELKNNILLRETLRKSGARVAIVFGQEYGQCVDSTILGMGYTVYRQDPTNPKGPSLTSTSYSEGLLDIGIDVVTARDVLAPHRENTDSDSPYFSFDMQDNIRLDKPASKPESPEKSALTAATKAPVEYAKNAPTEKAATQAPTHA